MGGKHLAGQLLGKLFDLKMEEIYSSGTSVNFYETTITLQPRR
jgi:hypothetical protein